MLKEANDLKGLKVIISIFLVFSFTSCGVNNSSHTLNTTNSDPINSTANVAANKNKSSINIENINEKLATLVKELADDTEKDVILKHLSTFKEKSELKTSSIFFGNESGNFYMTPTAELPGDYDPRTRDWYKITKENGEYVSDIYIDYTNNNKLLTIGKGVYKNKKLIGVVALDLVVENNDKIK